MNTNLNGSDPRDASAFEVKFNLLAEWSDERLRIQLASRQIALGFAVAGVITALALPYLAHKRSDADRLSAFEGTELSTVLSKLASLRKLNDHAKVSSESIAPILETNGTRFTGHLLALLNSAGPQLAFSDVKAEVRAGRMIFSVRGDAENFTAISDFVQRASKSDGVTGNLSATRPNQKFGNDGLAFEFQKQVPIQ